MPIPIPDAVDEAGALARTKATQARNLPRYAIASMLAGAYVGVAVVLLIRARSRAPRQRRRATFPGTRSPACWRARTSASPWCC